MSSEEQTSPDNSGLAKELDAIHNQRIDATILNMESIQAACDSLSMPGRMQDIEQQLAATPITSSPAPTRRCYAPGTRVKAASTNMPHYGYNGTIVEIKYGREVWIHWSDGDRTYVSIEKCDEYLEILEVGYKCPIPPPVKCNECTKPCPNEAEYRKVLGKQEEARQRYKREIKISQTVIDYWQRELKEHLRMGMEYPFMYLLGMKGDVITDVHNLRGYKGCKDMQRISPYELSNAYITFQKRGIAVAGIARVGIFDLNNTQSIDGINRIMQGEGILISVNKDGMSIRQYIANDTIQEAITHTYKIVRQKYRKRKGVKRDASKESETGKADQSATG